MRPHAQDFDNMLAMQHLIDEAVLDVDSAGNCTLQVADKRFIRRRSLKRINGKDAEQPFDIWPQT